MNKIIAAIVVLVVIIGGGLALNHNNKKGTSNSSTTNTTTTPQTQSSNNSSANQSNNNQAATSTNQVKIADMAFSPADITVKKGTTVTWTNNDSINHTVTENDGKNGPNSAPLGQGQSYTFTYNQTGSFAYHCSIHPEMTGTVTVTD